MKPATHIWFAILLAVDQSMVVLWCHTKTYWCLLWRHFRSLSSEHFKGLTIGRMYFPSIVNFTIARWLSSSIDYVITAERVRYHATPSTVTWKGRGTRLGHSFQLIFDLLKHVLYHDKTPNAIMLHPACKMKHGLKYHLSIQYSFRIRMLFSDNSMREMTHYFDIITAKSIIFYLIDDDSKSIMMFDLMMAWYRLVSCSFEIIR